MWMSGKRVMGAILGIVAVALCCELGSMGRAQESSPRVRRRGAAAIDAALSAPEAQPVDRLREGAMLIDQLGTFKMAGDQITFRMEGEQGELGVLENLTLERVWKMLIDVRDRQWTVSGMVTEYRGRNYLLLHRAVLRARAD